MKKFTFLLELASLVCPDDALRSEVQLAENQPLNYLSQFQDEMLKRGIERAMPELPWLALVDGLAKRGLLVELDWKDDPSELIETAIGLTKDHPDSETIAKTILKVEPFIDEDIEEFLPQLNSKLKKFDVQLGWYDIDSDSYPLSLIPFEHLTRVKELALESGYGIIKT